MAISSIHEGSESIASTKSRFAILGSGIISTGIWASHDHMDLVLDLSDGRVPCSAVCILAVSRELSSADEKLYLILQIEARYGHVTVSVVKQVEFFLMLL